MDTYLLHVASTLPHSWLHTMLFITRMGSMLVLITVAIVFACVALFLRRPDLALLMTLSMLSLPSYAAIKMVVHRARPISDMVVQLRLSDYSFPSGHALASLVVYGTLAYVLYHLLPSPWAKISVFFFVLLVALIGFSRVYLQVHYPTDVLGGWLIGAVYLLGIRQFFIFLRRSPSVF